MPAQGVQLQILLTAEVPIPAGYVFRAPGSRVAQIRAGLTGAERVRSPCLAFVVRHPSAGVILIDTGFHPDAKHSVRRDFGAAMGLLFRGLETADQPYDVQLRSFEVDPQRVERVVMTHLHVDHTSGMRLLPQATFICTRTEWEAAHKRLAAANGFVRHHLPPADRMQLLDYTSAGQPHAGFGQTIDLLGDGTVRLISTPGHTPGHQSVLLALEDGRRVLLVGDAAYTVRSIREQMLPLLTADDADYRRSLTALKSFSEQHPDAVVVPTHDPEAWRQLAGGDGQAAAPAASSPSPG